MVSSFLYSLGGGMLAVLATGRVDQIAWRFVRLVGFIALAVLVLPLVWSLRIQGGHGSEGYLPVAFPSLAAVSAIVVAVLAPAFPRMRGAFHFVCAIGGLAGFGAGYFAAQTLIGDAARGVPAKWLLFAGQAFGSLLLGSITVAWLLGHAYLTATKMTIAPMRHFAQLLLWAIFVRAAFFLLSVVAAWMLGGVAWRTFLESANHSMLTWVFIALRAGVGLIAVGVFAWMVRDCVRLRATQSATGILYFGSVFAYVGELCGQQLLSQFGWPV